MFISGLPGGVHIRASWRFSYQGFLEVFISGLPGGFHIRASWRFSYQGFLEVFAFWGEPGIFLLKIIICIKSGTLLGNIFMGGGVADFFGGGGGDSSPKTGLQEALHMKKFNPKTDVQ